MNKIILILAVTLLCIIGSITAIDLDKYVSFNPSASNVTYIINSSVNYWLNATVNSTCVEFQNTTHIDTFCNESVTPIYIYLYSINGSIQSINLGEYVLCESNKLQTEDVPCIFLFEDTDCSGQQVEVLNGSYSHLINYSLTQYNSQFCGALINLTTAGVYFLETDDNQKTYLILGDEIMRFFNLVVYLAFIAIYLVFVYFMHKYREDNAGSTIAYGFIATTFMIIIGALILNGFVVIDTKLSLFFNLNTYLAILCFILATYSGLMGYAVYQFEKQSMAVQEE